MERALIKDLHDYIGKEVKIAGWVDTRRDHGKLAFFDIRDRSGILQTVILPNHTEAVAASKELRGEWVVECVGVVNSRPEKMVNPLLPTGDIELEITAINILSRAQELPFEKDTEVNLDTHLDYLPYTLRSKRSQDIFTVQSTILEAYRESLRLQGFREFQAPAIVGGDAEGGSAVFKINYFNNIGAYLATSPQLYKEIMVGAFERAFTVAKVFRAEKSATTRHLAEITQMDFEMGFIQNHNDVMTVLEKVIRHVVATVKERHSDVFRSMQIEPPLAPESFPVLTLTEAQHILEAEMKTKVVGELDMAPEHERVICEWALREKKSDFIFITHYPTNSRAFYTYEDPTEKPFSRSFDLLFRGIEINSGSQRIHEYDALVTRMKERGMDPKKFSYYLQAFKYGMPPHGGCSTGLERFTARMLQIQNVKEATAFPRDINRIDSLLSQ